LSLGDSIAVISAVEAIIGPLIEITFIATFTQRFFARCARRAHGRMRTRDSSITDWQRRSYARETSRAAHHQFQR
jgi:hypothetical protein